MKEAEEFLKEWEDFSDQKNLPRKMILKAMEEYAQYKVNELNKSDVIKSVYCACKHPEMYRKWGEVGCDKCNKLIEQ